MGNGAVAVNNRLFLEFIIILIIQRVVIHVILYILHGVCFSVTLY